MVKWWQVVNLHFMVNKITNSKPSVLWCLGMPKPWSHDKAMLVMLGMVVMLQGATRKSWVSVLTKRSEWSRQAALESTESMMFARLGPFLHYPALPCQVKKLQKSGQLDPNVDDPCGARLLLQPLCRLDHAPRQTWTREIPRLDDVIVSMIVSYNWYQLVLPGCWQVVHRSSFFQRTSLCRTLFFPFVQDDGRCLYSQRQPSLASSLWTHWGLIFLFPVRIFDTDNLACLISRAGLPI